MSFTITREYDKNLFQWYLLLLLWVPIPLGSNRGWSSMLLVFVSAAILCNWLVLFLKERVALSPAIFHARWALLSLACFQLWVLVQTFVLPAAVLNRVAPEVFSLYQQTGFNQPVYLSLSVDNSLKAFVLGLGLLFAFVLTLLLVNTQERKQQFYRTLVISGVFQASIGIMMVLADHNMFAKIEQLFHSNLSSASGTFVNSNHFAGYLNICLAIAFGLFLTQWKEQPYKNLRTFLRSGIESLLSSNMRLRIYLMIMLIALLLSYSRMGNLAFFLALTISVLILLLKHRKLKVKVLVLLTSLLVIDVLLVGAWFGADKLVDRIENTNFTTNTRTEINAVSRLLMMDHLITGVGADAYKVIEPAYNTMPSDAITEHAHNDYYEFVINTGLPGVACLLLFAFFTAREVFYFKTAKGNQSTAKVRQVDFGLMMLMIYVAIHSLADFNLQIPAFSFTLLACLATAFIKDQNKQNLPTKGSSHAV
jgi:O-antigen ligase